MDTSALSRVSLRIDGLFLCVAGSLAIIMDAIGHFLGLGPLAAMRASPHSIGGFEAHGLAIFLGVLLVLRAGKPPRRPGHWLALLIHAFLGASNLLFWSSFEYQNLLAAGYITTTIHAVFVALHAWLLSRTAMAS